MVCEKRAEARDLVSEDCGAFVFKLKRCSRCGAFSGPNLTFSETNFEIIVGSLFGVSIGLIFGGNFRAICCLRALNNRS